MIRTVTVVVMTRNRAARLGATLERLLDLPERPRVIVVDNASSDGSAELVAGRFPGVDVIRLDRNRGAVARNVGVAAADTPYVAFADDDSWWAPGALARAAELFDRYPRLGLLAGQTLVGEEERVDPMSSFMATAPLGGTPDSPGPAVLGFLACASVVRREAFRSVGGFDPVVFFMGEEARLAYDLAAAGWRLTYASDVVAHHRPGPGDPAARRALAHRNAMLMHWMRRPLPMALHHTASLMADATTDPVARRAVIGMLARLPRALARRRPPDPVVEAALAELERRERSAGYSALAPTPAGNGLPAG
jgi:GT2 family glycosyltransferase